LIRIGTAGWTIPKPHSDAFPSDGTHLQRYARRLPAVEINSSFYRPHKPPTYARWSASVPTHFRFAVKVPREITHVRKLVATTGPLDQFLSEIQALGGNLGPLLVQLPPSFGFNDEVAGTFFNALRTRFDGDVACEPRHPSWFTDEVDAMLTQCRIARVAADPAPVPGAAVPGGWSGLIYRRLHGSPRMYYSPYAMDCLDRAADGMRQSQETGQEEWCIFDNTALGHATGDALALLQRIQPDL
jgi:uncharacterized protein YecE (DUF72 family)